MGIADVQPLAKVAAASAHVHSPFVLVPSLAILASAATCNVVPREGSRCSCPASGAPRVNQSVAFFSFFAAGFRGTSPASRPPASAAPLLWRARPRNVRHTAWADQVHGRESGLSVARAGIGLWQTNHRRHRGHRPRAAERSCGRRLGDGRAHEKRTELGVGQLTAETFQRVASAWCRTAKRREQDANSAWSTHPTHRCRPNVCRTRKGTVCRRCDNVCPACAAGARCRARPRAAVRAPEL